MGVLMRLFFLFVGNVIAMEIQDSNHILSPTGGTSSTSSSSSAASSSSSLTSSFLQLLHQSDSFNEILNRAYRLYTNPEIFYNMQLDQASGLGFRDSKAFANRMVQSVASAGDAFTPLSLAKVIAAVTENILTESGFVTDKNRPVLLRKSFDILKKLKESIPPSATDAEAARAFSNAYVEFLSSFPNLSSDRLESYFLQEMRSLKDEL